MRGDRVATIGARGAAIAAGVWLMAAPTVLGHLETAAETNDRIVGPVAAAIALISAWGVTRVLRWVQLPLGLWLLVSPLVLGLPAAAAVSDVLAGLVLVVTAFVRGHVGDEVGGGWRSLRQPMPGCDA